MPKKKNKLDDSFVRATVGFLYICYKSRSKWFLLIFLLRRIIISAIVAVVDGQYAINLGCIIVLQLFLAAQLYLRPFKKSDENRCQILEVGVLTFTFTCLQTISYNLPLFVFIILVNIAFILLLVVSYIKLKFAHPEFFVNNPTTKIKGSLYSSLDLSVKSEDGEENTQKKDDIQLYSI